VTSVIEIVEQRTSLESSEPSIVIELGYPSLQGPPGPAGSGGGSPVALAGDLGGTSDDGFVKAVRGVDSVVTFNVDGTANVVTTALGTKTMEYTSGKLTRVVGTGQYKTKTISYAGGQTAITVAP
jgi:hypothetical protein